MSSCITSPSLSHIEYTTMAVICQPGKPGGVQPPPGNIFHKNQDNTKKIGAAAFTTAPIADRLKLHQHSAVNIDHLTGNIIGIR